MKFTISSQIFGKYPETIIGVVIARNVDNNGSSEEINRLLRQEEEKIRNELNLENLAQDPLIKNWRKAYKLFGSDDRCSSEALIRIALKGGQIRHINKLVDIYNYISLKHKTPVGGEDIDKIGGNIYLKLASGTEKFIVLGGSEEENPKDGEIVYADDKEVLCRRWNWRESDNTKLTDDTKNAFLVIDTLPPVTEDTVKTALEEFAGLINKFCNAETKIFILKAGNSEIEF